MKDQWFPIGHKLVDDKICKKLLYQGEFWQIYQLNDQSYSLIVKYELLNKWSYVGLIDTNVFSEVKYSSSSYLSLISDNRYTLAPVPDCAMPETKADIQSFASALKGSRSIEKDASYHDAIYVEKYSRLLPVWSLTESVNDDVVIGSWITGGVKISVSSFRRFKSLTPWLDKSDLQDIIRYAELPILQNNYEEIKQTKSNANRNKSVGEKVEDDKNDFSLPGRLELESFFNEYVIDIIKHSERYRALGINFPSAIILHGPPGCGKTFAVDKLVEFLDWPSYSIDANSVASPYIHDTSKKIAEVFDKAIDDSPSIIVIDEMESFLTDRDTSSGLHHVEEVAEFLRRIPEAISKNVLIIGMTNRIEMIDPAILRRGRFDHIVEMGMPSATEIQSLLKSLLTNLPVSKNIETEILVSQLKGRPLSDAAFVIREAARLSAKSGETEIEQESILKSLESLPPYERRQTGNSIGFLRDSE